ncbi:MAG: diflavin oxidoreductase [Gammaproteobacteria bacterium]
MLSPEQLQAAARLSEQLDSRQLAWLSGYFAGLRALPPPSAAAAPAPSATVLYGTQTGNGKMIAAQLAAAAKSRRLEAEIISMSEYKTARLKKEKFLFAVISTHGEGDPPDGAAEFFAFLHGARAPKLPDLSYSVLALGDSSYEHFCKAGRDLDARLGALGARRLAELAECDLDFERNAEQWSRAAVESLAGALPATRAEEPSAAATIYNRANPFAAPVLRNIALNGPPRQTRHMELSLEDSGLIFRPGDSLGVWPQNPPSLALETAAALNLEWDSEIEIDGESAPVSEWLSSRLEIAMLTPPMLKRYGEIAGAAVPEDGAGYVRGRNFCDVARDFPPRENPAAALQCLRRIAPRLYSAASSALARDGEAHLLVGRDTYYDARGRMREGVCSSYLRRLEEGETAKVFVQSNDNFHLPDDNAAPLIMIGPGTGIAPFRAFMEEREERGGGGKNWLFFGERRRREDFYYQTEWQVRQKSGLLSRMDAAFSRDGAKIYVQDKMRRRGKTVWEWLADGAHVYVCGDERRMARDVHAELRRIAETHGGENGEEYMKKLRETGRYQRDVY